jgi:hypothetical protein
MEQHLPLILKVIGVALFITGIVLLAVKPKKAGPGDIPRTVTDEDKYKKHKIMGGIFIPIGFLAWMYSNHLSIKQNRGY